MLIPVEEAIDRLLAVAEPIAEAETVPVKEALGRVLARDEESDIDVPAVNNSAMDGYALKVEDAQLSVAMRVSQRIPAGTVAEPLEKGTLARIFTGAEVPSGANAVIMQEETQPSGDAVILKRLPDIQENVREAGQDIKKGQVIVKGGTRLRAQELGLFASVGCARLEVKRRLKIALMCTGDELVEPGRPLPPGHIYNSNYYALCGLVEGLGMEVFDLGIVEDSPQETRRALIDGAQNADCIISSGGVSVGEEDYVKAAVEALGTLDMWRLAIKPGKPLAFGDVNGTPFFGLPGNPVSTFITFCVIARPYLLKVQGLTRTSYTTVEALANFEFQAGSRKEYLRARVAPNSQGQVEASRYGNQGSGVMSSVSWANSLVEVEIGQKIVPGQKVKVILMSELAG